MKKITLTALIIAYGYCAYAQTNTFPATGNAGIGTTTPTLGSLTILAPDKTVSSAIAIRQSNGSAYGLDFGLDQQVDGAGYLYAVYGNVKTSLIRFDRTNNYVDFNGGNIGIGTAAPGEALDVIGNPVFGTYTERLSMGSGGFGFNRRVATGAIYDNTRFAYQFTHTPSASATADYLAFQVYNPGGGNVTPYAISINGFGNVGVGTNNTQGYMLAVAGSVIATSMTVKLQANWPDYVFKKNFHLPTLAETAAYINQNHHLPEIPSEQEIAKNGLNLGEMNKLLVKKVEELTLYLIELNKKVEQQQKEIEQLKSK